MPALPCPSEVPGDPVHDSKERVNRSIAILGATGLVGRTILRLIEERDLAVRGLRLLASDRPSSRSLPFRGREVPVEPVSADAFRGIDLALLASANAVSEEWAPIARHAGA